MATIFSSFIKSWVKKFKEEGKVSKENDNSKVDDFLLAEFNALQERARYSEQVKATKVNFFLLVVGAAGAWLGSIFSVQGITNESSNYLSIISLPLLILGILTFHNSILESLNIVAYYRYAGRIRLWFVEKNPAIAPYVPFAFADDRPHIYIPTMSYRGGEFVLLVVNTITFCTFLVSMLKPSDWNIAIIEILITFLVGWFSQVYYYKTYLKKYENKTVVVKSVNFPYHETRERIEKILQPEKKENKDG